MQCLKIELVAQLFDDMHAVHMDCVVWRMRCLGHRLIETGWEDIVNHLAVREAFILACLLPPHMHDTIITGYLPAASERELAFIAQHVPRLIQEPVHV